jgi:hypothetical protein
MKAQEILNKIRNVVGVKLSDELQVNLEELKLDNGTIVVSDSFEAGQSVFIKSDDGDIALPVGEYSLEDGRKLMIVEEGLIDAIGDVEVKEEVEEEVEASEETVTETELEEEEMKYVTKEEFSLALEEIKSMIEKLGDKEEMSEEKKEVELSTEVTEPIKHNPEKEDKKFIFKISNKEETTMDRIYNRLNNN